MEDKELKKLAIDIVENKVFGTFHMNKCEIANMGMIFMPLLFMSDEQKQELSNNKAVHFYEYLTEAGPRSVNGFPTFMSVRNIVEKDWKKIVKYMAKYEARVSSFLNEGETKKTNDEMLFGDM